MTYIHECSHVKLPAKIYKKSSRVVAGRRCTIIERLFIKLKKDGTPDKRRVPVRVQNEIAIKADGSYRYYGSEGVLVREGRFKKWAHNPA